MGRSCKSLSKKVGCEGAWRKKGVGAIFFQPKPAACHTGQTGKKNREDVDVLNPGAIPSLNHTCLLSFL